MVPIAGLRAGLATLPSTTATTETSAIVKEFQLRATPPVEGVDKTVSLLTSRVCRKDEGRPGLGLSLLWCCRACGKPKEAEAPRAHQERTQVYRLH